MKFEDLVAKWRTHQKIALAVGVTEHTVSNWKKYGIPRPRQQQIEDVTKGQLQADPDPAKALTRVHGETLEMLFRGMTIKEIAQLRGRSPATVDKTIEVMLARTKTHNTRELIYESLARGWLDSPQKYAQVTDLAFLRRNHVD